LSGLPNGAKFILQEARQGRLKGGYSALSSQLVVPAQYEAAIAAALGESLDGVLMEKSTDSESAVLALSKGEKGRTVLLPLNGADAALNLPALAEDADLLGCAVDLVQTPPNLQAILMLLLGQVVVVRDRQAARRMVEKLPAQARAVTLQGEVFYGSGVIVAGQDSRASAIGRPRRIQELQAAVAAAEAKAKEAQQRWQEVESELNRLRAKDRDLENNLRQLGQALSRANQAHQQAVLEVEQVRQRHEFQNRQLNGIDGQIQKAEQEQRQGQAEIEKNNTKIGTLNEQIRELNQSLGRLPVDELQAGEVHWNTAVAVASRALKDGERRLMEHRESLEAARRQMDGVRQRIESSRAALAQLDGERQTFHQQEAGLSQEIEALRLQIEPAEEQMAAADKAYNDQQTVLSAAQQAVSVADRYASQSQLEMTRVREALDALRRRVEEDFGLVAFEYNPEISGPTPLPLEGMVEQLPALTELSPEIEENINRQRAQLRRMGPINTEVQNEFRSVKERFEFLTVQVADLKTADADLREVITELDDLMRKEFKKTFDAVAIEFRQMFTRLFGGGSARLILSDLENPTEAGIDIEARLPGRREQGLSLLSGGERSLTAVALIFSLLKVSPTPFCVMDEVDAMLDEANVGRFRDLLIELNKQTQFIVVTHNRNTVQAANVIYGVTMGRDSASQVISLRLDEISEDMVR
jgi:chromosome segregation protein